MLKRARAIGIALALFGTASMTDAVAVPTSAEALALVGAAGDGTAATASFDPPLCPAAGCKPPIEPPSPGGECSGGLSGSGGLFGTGMACRTNVNRLAPSVPEPATLALLGVALLGFAAAKRRRR